MTDRNANRPGYKKTKAGWIPEEWEVKRFKDLAIVNPRKPRDLSDEVEVGFVPMANVSESGRLIEFDEVKSKSVNSGYTYFEDGDILIAKITPSFENGKGCIADNLPNGIGFGSTEFHVLRPKEVNTEFLHFHTRYYKFRIKGGLNMTGTAGQKRVPTDYLRNYKIATPPLIEQKKIAEILSTWDRAIEQTQKLIDAKQRLKKGLMQQLLTGRMRFPAFGAPVEKAGELPEGWEEKRLGHFLKMKLRKEEKPNQPFRKLGIRSHGKGIFISENENPQTYSMEYFFRVKEDDIVVNITFAWEGAIAYVGRTGDNALVSHRFPTYVVNKKIMDVQYFKYLIHTNRFFYDLGTISPGGAGRNRVLRKRDFLKIRVQYPKLNEQKHTSNSLKTLDRQIENLRNLLTNYIQQKNGLMQKLLTGEVRVKIQEGFQDD